jgi:hypothetical protein
MHMRFFAAASLLGGASLFMNTGVQSQSLEAPGRSGCAAEGDLQFVCGIASAEDLLPIEGGKYLVASSLDQKAAVGLYLVDTAAKTARPLQLSVAPTMDAQFSACPGAPDFSKMFTHGIEVEPTVSGSTRVYAIGHGGREAVEVFNVSPRDNTAAWVGCIVLPEQCFGNALYRMNDGSLLITQFFDKRVGQPIQKPTVTGLVFHWTPKMGLQKVPGSEFSGNNGVLGSRDGKSVFVAAWATDEVWKIPLNGKGPRTRAKFDFRADNLRWAPDGSILVVGQSSPIPTSTATPASAPAPEDWVLARLDPETMGASVLLKEKGTKAFGNGTSAAQVGNTVWFGTYGGDRIAYKEMP